MHDTRNVGALSASIEARAELMAPKLGGDTTSLAVYR